MEKYEILPTEENLIEALYRDTIKRNKDIVYFYNILQAQESASAIAIDGRWGSGKTFFVRQTQMVINALNPSSDMDESMRTKITIKLPFSKSNEEKENFNIAVYYDAWENDNDTEPILSLVYEITKQLSVDFSLSDISIVKTAGAIIEASLPLADMDNFYEYIGLGSRYYVDIVTRKIVKIFNFELREITRFVLQVKAAVYEPTHDNDKYNFSFPDGKGRHAIMTYIVPLLIGLKIADVSKFDDFVNGIDSEPLTKVFDLNENNYVLKNMLNHDETFDNEQGKRSVTQEEVIKRFYEAVFVTQYTGGKYNTVLGQYEFSKESKSFALRVANMMSDFAVLA